MMLLDFVNLILRDPEFDSHLVGINSCTFYTICLKRNGLLDLYIYIYIYAYIESRKSYKLEEKYFFVLVLLLTLKRVLKSAGFIF